MEGLVGGLVEGLVFGLVEDLVEGLVKGLVEPPLISLINYNYVTQVNAFP